MVTGQCEGCTTYVVKEPLHKVDIEYWRTYIWLCEDCLNDPNLDRETVASERQLQEDVRRIDESRSD